MNTEARTWPTRVDYKATPFHVSTVVLSPGDPLRCGLPGSTLFTSLFFVQPPLPHRATAMFCLNCERPLQFCICDDFLDRIKQIEDGGHVHCNFDELRRINAEHRNKLAVERVKKLKDTYMQN